MKKLTLLLAISMLSLSAQAQKPQKTQITFDVSAAYQPDSYFFENWVDMGFSPRDRYTILPIFEGKLGIRDFIGRSGWFYEASLMYNYTALLLEYGELTLPKQIDPYYGFVLESNSGNSSIDIDISEHYHSAGLSIGAGYRWQNRQGTKKLALPIGFKSYNTLIRKHITKTEEEKKSTDINKSFGEEDSFNNWLYYGMYFRPSYEFTSSKSKSPLSFALFADVNMIWDTWQDQGPSFLFGGGLGVRYELNQS